MLRRIEQASPIDRRSTKSRSSRLRTRSNEHAQNTQNATRNRHRPCRKYARKVTTQNENLCPERSTEHLRRRTQCSKQRLKHFQNVPKIKENRGPEGSKIKEILENRGPEGSKIKENLALDGSERSFWRLSAFWSEFYAKLDARCAKLGPRWQQVEPQMVHIGA